MAIKSQNKPCKLWKYHASLKETINIWIGLIVWEWTRKKRKNCPESQFYSVQNPLRTSRWNYDFPGWLEHSMSLLLELYIFLEVPHVTFHSESHVLMKKRAGGKTERRRGSHTKFGRGRHLRRWRVTARPSEEQITDCQELHWGSHVPSLFSPHPSKPFTYSSSRRWQNCQQQLLQRPGAGPLPSAAVFLGLINVSDS